MQYIIINVHTFIAPDNCYSWNRSNHKPEAGKRTCLLYHWSRGGKPASLGPSGKPAWGCNTAGPSTFWCLSVTDHKNVPNSYAFIQKKEVPVALSQARSSVQVVVWSTLYSLPLVRYQQAGIRSVKVGQAATKIQGTEKRRRRGGSYGEGGAGEEAAIPCVFMLCEVGESTFLVRAEGKRVWWTLLWVSSSERAPGIPVPLKLKSLHRCPCQITSFQPCCAVQCSLLLRM